MPKFHYFQKNGKNPRQTAFRTLLVYLDYNATTPLEEEVLTSIHEALRIAWGNPSSAYEEGKKAKQLIEEARGHVARMVGGKPEDIIFTSGGTEANNMVFHSAVKCFWEHHKDQPNLRPHIITSNLEHDSVKLVLENYQKEGKADVTFMPACKLSTKSRQIGQVLVEDIMDAIRPTTCLISIMMANNETGIIQPLKEICSRVNELNGERSSNFILLHTDAAQTLGKVPVDVDELGVDYLTIVGHKFYGPRIGALYVRAPEKETPIYPMFFGGGQERNYRPGTENTGMIAGLGKAAELVVNNLEMYSRHMAEIRNYLESKLLSTFGEVSFNGRYRGVPRLPNTCNVSLLGQHLKGDVVLSRCRYLQASVGSACHAQDKPSHILLAIGIPCSVARNALRLSVGRHTTKEDIDLVIEDLRCTVESLRVEKEKT